MMKRRFFALLTAILLMVICFGGCGDAVPEGGSAEGPDAPEYVLDTNPEIRLAYSGSDSMNPFEAEGAINTRLMSLIYDGLFTLDSTYAPQNALATGCVVGTESVNVMLDTNAYFSDGTRVKTADIIYSFEEARKAPAYEERLSNFTSVSSSNNANLVFTLEEPDPYAQNCLTFPIIKTGSDEEYPIGSGRYCIVKDSGRLLLSKNPYIKNFNPEITCIELEEIGDSALASSSLEIGNTSFSFTDLSSGSYTRINASNYDVLLNNLVYLGLNGDNEIMRIPAVRQAIGITIDRDNLAKDAYQGHAKGTVSPFNPSWVNMKGLDTSTDAYGVSAEELLESTGYDFTSFSLSLLVNVDNVFKAATAKAIADDLGKIGINVSIMEVHADEYYDYVMKREYDMYIGEIRLTANMDLTELFRGGSCAYGLKSDMQELSYDRYIQMRAGECEIMDFVNTFLQEFPFVPLCYRTGIASYTNAISCGEVICNDNDIYSNIESWKKST